ncbi:MAG: Asp-tRNA(Asn)/Glu-tRNA(Gln) amidotransferase subunit GatC [Candidatus Pacebacteria bacterium]|nr:Asp-tRNA(Asn)/Glu-tRNA(Gln) amidotransferase subunit GatC [Candidatus Paceibacterota bacterium]
MELKDVQHLAMLSRLEIEEDEQKALLEDLKSILVYIDQVQKAPISGDGVSVPEHRNIMREDVVTTKTGEYTDILLEQVVGKQDNFVKVKKIM